MEYIITILAALGVGAFLFNQKRKSEKEAKFQKKDAALKAVQDLKTDEIADLNERLKKIAEKAKDLDPKAAEDFWNDEDNS